MVLILKLVFKNNFLSCLTEAGAIKACWHVCCIFYFDELPFLIVYHIPKLLFNGLECVLVQLAVLLLLVCQLFIFAEGVAGQVLTEWF